MRKETTRACTFSCPHSRVTLHTHSPASICASSDPETRWNRMSPTREKKSKEADLVGLLRDRAQDPSTAVHPCLVQGQQSACAGYGCVHDEVVATMLRECSKETVGREARACMRRLEFVLHQSRPNFTSLNHRNSSVCAWQEHEHTRTHQWSSREGHAINSPSLSLSLYFQENKPSHAALISSKLSDLDALLRKGGAPEVQAPSTPQQQQLIRPVAVQAVCLLSRTRISSRSSSHADKERVHPHLLLLLVVVMVVVAHGPRQPALHHTQRGTAPSSVKWARAANVPHALHGRKKACVRGSV